MNIEQLKKLQKDYCERVKNFERNAKKFAKEKKYDEAAHHKTRGEIYAICARDIKSILTGKTLYTELTEQGGNLLK